MPLKRPSVQWPWHGLLALILLGLAIGLWVATKRVNYEWRWARVPQYFFYQAEDTQAAPVAGTINKINPNGAYSQVDITPANGGQAVSLTVETDTLKVKIGDPVAEGDGIGAQRHWKIGPLSWGLWVTIWISFVSGLIGLFIGLITGLCRLSPNPALRGLAVFYIELIRGTPLLVQIFIFYFFIGTVLNLDRIVAGIGALALFVGAYTAEIIRAGIQSIAKGQTEAARSLGMTAAQTMTHIVLPQALKRVLPPLAGQFISLIKDSSLVSVIAITDLTKSGREIITSSFATFEIWFTVALLYLVVTSLLSQLLFWLERRFARSD
ncbi:Polar amino acid ABC transporter, inner membrane subunit [Candidatus Competibacter denitrificans Run_A_D11]|mgnify:CR=1 FL=1|uniref:Putative glutamine transport system permease protein GlnP n=1 Tax=Candidatus Competibacter denitrificans Run_A_D11 TaxID=1400863 RepID=W6M7Q0_9GAMM|nr:amino acid ABC transporter permease [Candidatus Competibacter denitrificans]CDI01745.1 Polar amino acid ABC transporter, inner membrane subunit [Candidatus Competibacter denitrificans Run_A_D11]HAS87323.1 ABC transporter permease [Candidatus Competibacteraceae bacterium]HRC68903.1 ABC transporter permease subunit [Candidatus Competibacter denitrificans]